MKQWLDGSGCFLFGKYKGESVEDLVSHDPQYLRWIIDTIEDIAEEDREIISAHLARRTGRKR